MELRGPIGHSIGHPLLLINKLERVGGAMTGRVVTLEAEDGHRFSAYLAEPDGPSLGAIILVQEIFGLTPHILDQCDQWADRGYRILAPALFDRLNRGMVLSYDPRDTDRGRHMRRDLGWDQPLLDLAASVDAMQRGPRPLMLGYCWGGSLSWLAACRLPLAGAISYYGGDIIQFCDEAPKCPIQLHMGRFDPIIPPDTVAAIEDQNHPGVEIHLYDAGHGFNCDHRIDYDAECAAIADARSQRFAAKCLPSVTAYRREDDATQEGQP